MWPQCPIAVAPLLYLDIETTGLHPERGARITEIGVVDRKAIWLHWTGTPSEATYDAALSGALSDVAGVLRSGVVVAHNLRFDLGFLAREADRLGGPGFRLRCIDTLGLARHVLRRGSPAATNRLSVADYTLASLLQAFGIAPQGTLHTALGDARSTRALLGALVEYGGLTTLRDARMRRVAWDAF